MPKVLLRILRIDWISFFKPTSAGNFNLIRITLYTLLLGERGQMSVWISETTNHHHYFTLIHSNCCSHIGCYDIFGTAVVNSDLLQKTVEIVIPSLGYQHDQITLACKPSHVYYTLIWSKSVDLYVNNPMILRVICIFINLKNGGGGRKRSS